MSSGGGPVARCIKCENCGTVFLGVEEVQLHADQTGHNTFSESDEAPSVWRCEECGKPCRTLTERDLHTQRTGHSAFKQDTLMKDVNVVQEAKEIRQMKEAEAKAEMAAITGKPVQDKPPSDEEMVEPQVDEQALEQLTKEMGFSRDRAVRGLYCGGGTLEGAVQWLTDHQDDMDIDEPLLVPKSKSAPKKPLTSEEKAKLIEELRVKNKAKREREEKEDVIRRERERVRAGKEMAEARRLQEEMELERDRALRRREKEQDKIAKQQMKELLAREREERLKAAGKWTPEMEANKEAAAHHHHEPKQPKEQQGAKQKPVVAKPVLQETVLRDAVKAVKASNADEQVWRTAVQTLGIYLGNILKDVNEEKFRRIKTTNKAFQARVAPAVGAVAVLEAAGFERVQEDGVEVLVMPKDSASFVLLESACKTLQECLLNPYFGTL